MCRVGIAGFITTSFAELAPCSPFGREACPSTSAAARRDATSRTSPGGGARLIIGNSGSDTPSMESRSSGSRPLSSVRVASAPSVVAPRRSSPSITTTPAVLNRISPAGSASAGWSVSSATPGWGCSTTARRRFGPRRTTLTGSYERPRRRSPTRPFVTDASNPPRRLRPTRCGRAASAPARQARASPAGSPRRARPGGGSHRPGWRRSGATAACASGTAPR